MFNPVGSLINFIVGIIGFFLSLRFLGKFFGVLPTSTFVAWVYNFTQPLITPFIGILPSFSLLGFQIETPTVIALVIVGLIGYFLGSLFFSPQRSGY